MQTDRPESKQPLPEDAKKVFKGKIFDVYQWEQEQFDGSFETFEKLKRMDTAMVVPVTIDKKIILTKQEQPGKAPFLGLAGGRLEEGEDPIYAASRELLEETGHKATEFDLLKAFQPVSKIDWVVYTYVARDCERVADLNLDAGEKIELLFLDFDEFIDISLTDAFWEWELKTEIMMAKINNKMDEFRVRILGE